MSTAEISPEDIKQMSDMLERYNNAQTAEEGFGALNGLIAKAEEIKLTKDS